MLMFLFFIFLDIGCKAKGPGPMLKELMQTTNFRVTVVEESDVVEICGALKVEYFFILQQTKIEIYSAGYSQ